MTLKDQPRARFLGLALVLMSSAGQADTRLSDAQACTEEANRLARLACFDEVFDTPLARYEAGASDAVINQPERWRQAFSQAGQNDASGPIYRNTGSAAGHMVTVAALGAQPPRPVLTLQCHNNITELTVMLPKPISRERVDVALASAPSQWRVRDEGLVVSAGRGLPAIRSVLEIVHQPDVRIQADVPELDGLLFDLTGYRDAIRPLRQACGW
ncbi:type VI secretion system-associated protein VasI [Marinobacter sp. MDS2]|uniref:type VI secretion system-associated protein VasI n=1 Tax=Marinobacter sp. MDS2 TaxID=3065961 RepID=UPI00273C0DBC|nr:type VI secretion system-associated protein VasI [Marinobacter sp. MDS2]MDP4547707.1 type VI secretion system-associated protein VasI [Marinobacter sp. MDS2]